MGSELINKLTADGWRQKFTASGEKLKEAIANYQWLGFEVKTVPIKELGCAGCTVCFDDDNDDSVMIFTRKTTGRSDDELFEDDGTV